MEESISKSQRKREAEALQKIGSKLVDLAPTALDKIPMPADLRKAIDDAKTVKGRGGMRRQAQLIGKLIRSADHEGIIEAYRIILGQGRAMRSEQLLKNRRDIVSSSEQGL